MENKESVFVRRWAMYLSKSFRFENKVWACCPYQRISQFMRQLLLISLPSVFFSRGFWKITYPYSNHVRLWEGSILQKMSLDSSILVDWEKTSWQTIYLWKMASNFRFVVWCESWSSDLIVVEGDIRCNYIQCHINSSFRTANWKICLET